MEKPVFVSVIMPVRNEEAFIAQSLGAVLAQDYPSEHTEILIVDGASEDHTLEIIQSLPGTERVGIISNPCRTQAAGLNLAIQQAKGNIIIRVDGHTVIAPDYIRQCVQALQETSAYNVGGSLQHVGITRMGKAIASAAKQPFAVPGAFHRCCQTQYTDTVYLGAWPRWVFQQVGWFDECLAPNEDYEFNYRIRRAGGRIYLSEAIQSSYFGRQTLRALAHQYFRYGKAKTLTLKKHPASLRLRQIVAPAFLGMLVMGLPCRLLASALFGYWLMMLCFYLAANLFFSFRAARQDGYTLFWRIPLVFLTLHLAWGAGFWIGFLSGGERRQPRKKPSLFRMLLPKDS